MNPNQNEKPKNKRDIFVTVLAVAFIFVYIVSHLSYVSSWVEAVISVLSPLIIGATIAYLCNPILRFMEKHPLRRIRSFSLRRMLSIFLTYLVVILLIAAIFLLVIPQLMDSIGELIAQYDNYIANAVTYVNGLLNSIMEHLPFEGPEHDLISIDKVQAALQTLLSKTDTFLDLIMDFGKSYASRFVSALSDIILALFISFYLLASKEKRLAQSKKIVAALCNDKQTKFIYETVSLADKTFGKYLEGKIMDSLLVGIICYITFTIAGLPYAAMTSTFIGVANIIPFFGPIIGSVPSGFIIFISDPSKLFLFIILTLIIMQVDGNIIEPKVLGNSTGVSSLCIIVAISVMGSLWGVFGMVVGVPLAAVVVALAQEFINTRLKNKGMSENLDDYYSEEDENEPKPQRTSPHYYLALVRYYFRILKRLFRRKKGEALPKPNREDFIVNPVPAEGTLADSATQEEAVSGNAEETEPADHPTDSGASPDSIPEEASVEPEKEQKPKEKSSSVKAGKKH